MKKISLRLFVVLLLNGKLNVAFYKSVYAIWIKLISKLRLKLRILTSLFSINVNISNATLISFLKYQHFNSFKNCNIYFTLIFWKSVRCSCYLNRFLNDSGSILWNAKRSEIYQHNLYYSFCLKFSVRKRER